MARKLEDWTLPELRQLESAMNTDSGSYQKPPLRTAFGVREAIRTLIALKPPEPHQCEAGANRGHEFRVHNGWQRLVVPGAEIAVSFCPFCGEDLRGGNDE